jgi:hypothetical protein
MKEACRTTQNKVVWLEEGAGGKEVIGDLLFINICRTDTALGEEEKYWLD